MGALRTAVAPVIGLAREQRQGLAVAVHGQAAHAQHICPDVELPPAHQQRPLYVPVQAATRTFRQAHWAGMAADACWDPRSDVKAVAATAACW